MGLVLRRLIGRLLVHRTSQDPSVHRHFVPHQLAIGTKCGTEAIIHVTGLAVDRLERDDMVLLKIDATNAFNAIERQVILDEVVKHVPGIARFVHMLYGSAPRLLFGRYELQSQTGAQQGDPLRMILFTLALHPLLCQIATHFPDIKLLASFADDINAILPLRTASLLLQFLQVHGPCRGFHVNLRKTEAWWCGRDIGPLPCSVNTNPAIDVLGAPIGAPSGCLAHLQDKITAVQCMWERIRQLQDPQIAYHLLCFSASASRLTYVLRATPPHITAPACQLFDTELRRVFEDVHRPLSDAAWHLAQLPFKVGGLGLLATSHVKESAYVSSLMSTLPPIRGLLPACHFLAGDLIAPSLAALNDRFPWDPTTLWTPLPGVTASWTLLHPMNCNTGSQSELWILNSNACSPTRRPFRCGC